MRKRSARTSPGRKRTGPEPGDAERAADPDGRGVRRRDPEESRGAVPVGVAEESAPSPQGQEDPSAGRGREQTVQLAT
jgi:hypothetical protein